VRPAVAKQRADMESAVQSSKPIYELAEIGTLHVEVLLPVEAYWQVKSGMKVDVRPEIPAGTRHRRNG